MLSWAQLWSHYWFAWSCLFISAFPGCFLQKISAKNSFDHSNQKKSNRRIANAKKNDFSFDLSRGWDLFSKTPTVEHQLDYSELCVGNILHIFAMFNSIHLSAIQWSVASKFLFSFRFHGLFDQSTKLIENMRLKSNVSCIKHHTSINNKKKTHILPSSILCNSKQKKARNKLWKCKTRMCFII